MADIDTRQANVRWFIAATLLLALIFVPFVLFGAPLSAWFEQIVQSNVSRRQL